jgi:DNA-binding transcriptional regulator YdaS (Cro superfamily)
MDLRSYTSDLPHGGMTAFAAALGIKPIYLSQLAARQDGREPSPALCVDIERATDLKVRRWDLRPKDWYRIWPELIGTAGAPDTEPETIPEAKAA